MENQWHESLMVSPEPHSKRFWRKGYLIMLVLLITLILAPLAWRFVVRSYYAQHIDVPVSTPPERVAIVFGAAVYGDGRLSSVLRDRMDTAVSLYNNGKVDKILVSGDNSSINYNEPAAMRDYAAQQGIPLQDIQPDFGGRRTYDTCYRARKIFNLNSVILVTQEFHLPRALFTCRWLGLDAVGISADLRPYRGARWYEFRETAASLNALWDIIRQNPPAVLGDPIPLV